MGLEVEGLMHVGYRIGAQSDKVPAIVNFYNSVFNLDYNLCGVRFPIANCLCYCGQKINYMDKGKSKSYKYNFSVCFNNYCYHYCLNSKLLNLLPVVIFFEK